MSMKRLAIMSAVGSHNNFNNHSVSYYSSNEKGGQQGLQTMRPGANLHGNVNIMLGGAMLSVVITIVCFVCYCCHRNIKKRSTSTYRQRWMENDPNMEIYSVEQCYDTSGLFTDPPESMTLPPQQTVIVGPVHGPPPSYEQVVALDEIVARQHQQQKINHTGNYCPFTNNGTKCNGCGSINLQQQQQLQIQQQQDTDYNSNGSDNELLQNYCNRRRTDNDIDGDDDDDGCDSGNSCGIDQICDFRLDPKFSTNLCRFCGKNINDLVDLEYKCRCTNVNMSSYTQMLRMNNIQVTTDNNNENNTRLNLVNDDGNNGNNENNINATNNIDTEIDKENCNNNNNNNNDNVSVYQSTSSSSTATTATTVAATQRNSSYQNMFDFVAVNTNQIDFNDNNNLPSTSTLNNNCNNNNNNNNNNTITTNDLNQHQSNNNNNNDNNNKNIIDFENINEENGIIRLDMSQIIDNTGLPTYEAALQLESSGYV